MDMRKVSLVVVAGVLFLALAAGTALAANVQCPTARQGVCDGTSGPDVMNGMGTINGRDIMSGFSGGDRMNGNGGSDVIFGDAGDDLIFGGSGNDEMLDGLGSDSMSGSSGDDLMLVGLGRDVIFGGAGSDIIYADGDRTTDRVSCGSGFDRVTADPGDLVSLDCEKVKRT
jgi:Ca2+-binding RTX toxin-like protein